MDKSLLFEIGTEELPSSFVDAALAALPDLVKKKLADLRLAHGDVHAYGTPRRLAVLVTKLADAQADVDEEVAGPPAAAAFKDGAPTKAAEAFATKLGVSVSELRVEERPAVGKQKAGSYVVGRLRQKGQPAAGLLPAALADVSSKIPFRKSMRWGAGDVAFGRPVQWLVALFGEDTLSVEFGGQKSGRKTRGHRFLAPDAFDLASADEYVSTLRQKHVLVDRKEREETMLARVAEAAKAAGGAFDLAPILVSENASLVEEPHVITGSFEARFLTLPASVIKSVARGHQRYFCLEKDADTLLPTYLVIANTALAPAKIAQGNDRVMRARLADAQFFFEEDKKASLAARTQKLHGIVFHNRLGTVREKVDRIEKLSREIADALGGLTDVEKKQIDRAAHLSKFDLVSLMVGEFPELQGDMGRVYAKNAGEDDAVADAVRDHYKPVGASDALPPSDVSRIVALSDRLDTLTGCFAVGLEPTGSADPFALRRNAIAALRILMEHGAKDPRYANLSFASLVEAAYGQYENEQKKLDLSKKDAVEKLTAFASERLRGLLAQASSSAVADAVIAGHTQREAQNGSEARAARVVEFPAYALWRAKALEDAVRAKSPWLATARAVAKRLSGISKNTAPVAHTIEAFSASPDAVSKNKPIVDLVNAIDLATRAMTTEASVHDALASLPRVAEGLEKIFTDTLVNDPNDPLSQKRLELLSHGARCILRIGDFTALGL